jgi:hypothetical protein
VCCRRLPLMATSSILLLNASLAERLGLIDGRTRRWPPGSPKRPHPPKIRAPSFERELIRAAMQLLRRVAESKPKCRNSWARPRTTRLAIPGDRNLPPSQRVRLARSKFRSCTNGLSRYGSPQLYSANPPCCRMIRRCPPGTALRRCCRPTLSHIRISPGCQWCR